MGGTWNTHVKIIHIRSGRTWEIILKWILKAGYESVNYMELAQNWVHFRACVNTAVILRICSVQFPSFCVARGSEEIQLYIDDLFNDAFNSPEYIAWNVWMISEEWFGRNLEGRVYDVIATCSWSKCLTPDGPTHQSRVPTRHDVYRPWFHDLRTATISSQVSLQFEKIRNGCRCVSVHGA